MRDELIRVEPFGRPHCRQVSRRDDRGERNEPRRQSRRLSRASWIRRGRIRVSAVRWRSLP